jgi:hypothetical protein
MLGITDISINLSTESKLLASFFFILLVLIAYYVYRSTNPPITKSVRIILTSLRIIAIIVLFLALFEPVISFKKENNRKPVLNILRDQSGSMDFVENGKSRRDRIDSLLESDKFKNFRRNFDIRQNSFAGGLASDGSPENLDQTALGNVIEELSRLEMGTPSDYWLLLSDGISNSGMAPLDAVAGIRTPIYSVGVGLDADERDVAITGSDCNDILFAGKPSELTAHLEWNGMNNDQVQISIRAEGQTLQSKTVSLPPGNLREDITLKFIPEKLGRQSMEISLSNMPNEVSAKNNSRLFSVLVMKSKMNVLLVSDKLDWEYSFLRRFLSQSESVELTPVVFKENGGYISGQFPSKQAELNRFDLIILYDLSENSLKSRVDLLSSYLTDNRGGLFVFLGENYLKADFPRAIDNFLPFMTTSNNARLIHFSYNGQPNENYLFHPAVRLADDRRGIRQAWSSLPHFESAVPLDSIPPSSEIFVSAGLSDDGGELPILGFRKFGSGKVMATSAAPYWHWAFFGYGFGEDASEYQMFHDGIINWLSLREDSDPIRIIPDKNIFSRGEKIGFTASVYDLGFRPIESASGEVTLTDRSTKDTTVMQFIETKDGRYRAEIDLLPPGIYDYSGVVNKDTRLLKESYGQIAVTAFSIEEIRRRPDFGMLAGLSQKTGGTFLTLDNIDSLYSSLRTGTVPESKKIEIVLWNKFWLLAVFILTLGTEWLLRKKYQLI